MAAAASRYTIYHNTRRPYSRRSPSVPEDRLFPDPIGRNIILSENMRFHNSKKYQIPHLSVINMQIALTAATGRIQFFQNEKIPFKLYTLLDEMDSCIVSKTLLQNTTE